jgi:hypothetical protein
LNVSVIGDSGVSSTTRVLPLAVEPEEEEFELLQAAAARLRMAHAATPFMILCFISLNSVMPGRLIAGLL